ncbi:hypothetical protein NKOR_06990 [Candidatus Nitrosopumilus koreensis AR1]|uniref:Uncharacterized protein n=1 Tax=Candidatus Nitrosopumilus koreensis AR1 TaxID=1229908 RepID=K0B6Z5_9ARCH|nr:MULTISPECIES: hypothetical protein [Nitrosopumilus]AFS81269.1 hypothetical protein NKOR_06990 [Candidatus Nitrosopumilus koreensis AR1]
MIFSQIQEIFIQQLRVEKSEMEELKIHVSDLQHLLKNQIQFTESLGDYMRTGSTKIVENYDTETLEHYGVWESLRRLKN